MCCFFLHPGSPAEVRVDMYVANIWAMEEVKMVRSKNKRNNEKKKRQGKNRNIQFKEFTLYA